MKRSLLSLYAIALWAVPSTPYAQTPKLNSKTEALFAKMTIEEKVGQMAQVTLDVIGKGENRFSSFEPLVPDTAELNKAVVKYKLGSILNTANNRARTPQAWNQLIGQIQDAAINKTRLGIPVIFGIDAVHGTTYTAGATMFPQQINQAAARNRALVRKGAEITAYETRASSIPWNFSPVLDLGADPRFSRQFETFGEDPYLISELGKEMIKGYEGEDISHPEKVATSLKHFLGYMVPASGKDRTPVYLSEQALREYHLPAFKAAIDAGAHTVMINSGIINNIPVHANYEILTKLLKEELGFKGLVITDWGDIENLFTRDRIARDHKQAIELAINAGIDMSMVAYNYEVFCDNLIALVKEGRVKESRLNDAVRRILWVKQELGLFERPVTDISAYPKFGSDEFRRAAFESAAESITLLKNEKSVLPFTKGKKILVTGPNSHSMRTLNGGWTYSWQGEKVEEFASAYHTILEALQKEAGVDNVIHMPGVSYKMDGKYYEEFADRFDETVAAAREVDAIVLCIGENSYTETPGNLNDLYLSDLQTELALRLSATGKPVVVVLNEGRPRIISKFADKVQAIVQVYLPGNYGGDALADILFGDVNPSGKLPYTYPQFPNSMISYIHKPSEERETVEGVYNYSADFNPQFTFGHGLSYTTFTYSNLELSKPELAGSERLSVSVDVANTGNREGKEVVELYTSDLFATITPDVKRLRRFEKISLKPGEKRTVTFSLTKDDLSFIGLNGNPVVESGEFKILIGNQSKNFIYTR
ncbi:MAG TPA: glycoside hydrolase family 3 N-terminal domain-containing protein [Sphingobacteriaceae bacterium]